MAFVISSHDNNGTFSELVMLGAVDEVGVPISSFAITLWDEAEIDFTLGMLTMGLVLAEASLVTPVEVVGVVVVVVQSPTLSKSDAVEEPDSLFVYVMALIIYVG